MKLEKSVVITDDRDIEYVVMSVIDKIDRQYVFANKFDNDNPTDEFCVFTVIDGKIEILEDNDLINQLLPLFQNDIDRELKLILNDNK